MTVAQLHRKPTQRQRLLAALRNGPVNETRFAAPDVLDGGTPIQRVAARVYELRQAGYWIDTVRQSNGTATYHLRAEPGTAAAGEAADHRAA
ncbi:unannotated protein [freshwater metagenome]|uniref:Unannotated protein n=1 Tax=freshwater metagenome TaxID=449393 RepID=A0A6J7FRF8_9ZZZZ|nr:hypothetical protein [Actinomycetota bacterium]